MRADELGTSGDADHGDAAERVPVDDPRPSSLRHVPSLVIVNTGRGKGKSSSAFGMMLRALAQGWSVAVVQFIKSGNWKTGEEKIGRQLGAHWHCVGDGFSWDSKDLEHDAALAREGWALAASLIESGEHRLVILDELTYLVTWGWLDVNEIVRVIEGRPPQVSIVITGRDAHPALIDAADTVTEMREVKHAYAKGIAAKKGIDY